MLLSEQPLRTFPASASCHGTWRVPSSSSRHTKRCDGKVLICTADMYHIGYYKGLRRDCDGP